MRFFNYGLARTKHGFAITHPVGMHRSVEKYRLPNTLHSVRNATNKRSRMHSYRNAGIIHTIPFSTERCIPNGMQTQITLNSYEKPVMIGQTNE